MEYKALSNKLIAIYKLERILMAELQAYKIGSNSARLKYITNQLIAINEMFEKFSKEISVLVDIGQNKEPNKSNKVLLISNETKLETLIDSILAK